MPFEKGERNHDFVSGIHGVGLRKISFLCMARFMREPGSESYMKRGY